MITENLSTLKINKLTRAQYEAALEAGRINENELYMTPESEAESGGVQPDWNVNDKTSSEYVKNRPFYTYDEEVTVCEEVTLNEFVLNGLGYKRTYYNDTFGTAITGATQPADFVVYFDGIRYPTKLDVSDRHYIGNAYIYNNSLSNTGEPFCFCGNLNVDTMESFVDIYTTLEGTSHTFSVYKIAESVVTIPEKYLPETIATKKYVDSLMTVDTGVEV